MLSKRHKCIFVHIPRCGGTSVESIIWPGRRTPEELWMGFVDPHHNKYQTGALQHLLARQIRQEIGESRFSSYFKFAIVRNPFDRLVSQFAYMGRRQDLRAFAGMPASASFADYLALIRGVRHVQWEPQTSFLYEVDGTLLVDFVGRFEHLAEDMAVAFERLGLNNAELPHLNRSRRAPYQDYYTPDLQRQVSEMYATDLHRFGYEF